MKRSPFLPIASILSLFALATSTTAPAQDASLDLSLREAIEQGLAANLSLRIQKMEPDIAEASIEAQQAAFDPTLFSNASLNQSDLDWTDEDGNLRQTISDSRSYSLGVSKRVAIGGQLTASARHSRSDGSSFNPDLNQLVGGGLSERASLSLEYTQPLLRDFGKNVNLAGVRRAKSQARVADLQTRSAVFDLLQETETAYWRLAYAYQRLKLRRSNLELSQSLLEESEERQRLGLATRIETLQAQANLAQRQEEIIVAEQQIKNATDDLLAVIGALDEQLAIEQELTVSQLPEASRPEERYQDFLQTALERNFDTDIQEELLEQLEQQRILAKNERRPQVDLTLSSSYNGLSPISGEDAFSEAFDRRGDDWGMRLSFTLPWGQRSAKATLKQTEWRIEQGEIQLAEIRQNLLRSARSAWRDRLASAERLYAAELVVELQQATYEQERGKYDEGLSTFRTLLEAQRDLDQAKLSLLDARLEAIESDITLARVEGTILERHGIDWNVPLEDDADLPIEP
ncbi:TolC family protein [Pelagicoccus sp. SDUM812003]|uniref:TolC family protein n=1 Tax=Pelagicoccus sp. SDUM812003 TaxID=3041267 RepID=UPI00280DED1C|nr:TolC family protein [Pelagicoccus sp. SDUM812003]MDQ8204555.1 TolC family protein [Pelagicoccus sp. SDUM812003]